MSLLKSFNRARLSGKDYDLALLYPLRGGITANVFGFTASSVAINVCCKISPDERGTLLLLRTISTLY